MKFDFLKNKKILLTIIASSIVFGLIFTFTGHSAIKATSDDKFCVSCHTWMQPMVDTYLDDKHGGKNQYGIKTTCVSCHLPHSSLASYLFTKGVNGVVEVTSALTKDPNKMNWQEHRKNRESFVYDSGCLNCHKNIEETESQSAAATKMHNLYTKYKDANKDPLKCTSCHKNVGHEDLSKVLYDRTHEPVGEWEEDLK